MGPRGLPRWHHPQTRAPSRGRVEAPAERPRRSVRAGAEIRGRRRPRRRSRDSDTHREPLPADGRLPQDAPRGGVGPRRARGAALRDIPLGGGVRADIRRGSGGVRREGHAVHRGRIAVRRRPLASQAIRRRGRRAEAIDALQMPSHRTQAAARLGRGHPLPGGVRVRGPAEGRFPGPDADDGVRGVPRSPARGAPSAGH